MVESAIAEIDGLHTDVYMWFVALEDGGIASARGDILSCALGTECLLDGVYTGSTGNCGSGGAEKGLRERRHGEMNEQETKEGERGDEGGGDSGVGDSVVRVKRGLELPKLV